MGDLNGDFRNDHADFALFKAAFESTNGAGSFAAIVIGVPEPANNTDCRLVAGSLDLHYHKDGKARNDAVLLSGLYEAFVAVIQVVPALTLSPPILRRCRGRARSVFGPQGHRPA